MMRRFVVSMLLCGCTLSAPVAAVVTVELPGLGLRMDVPVGTEVSRKTATGDLEARKTPWDGPVTLEFARGTRYPMTMTIDGTDESADADLERSDGALRYHISKLDGGMSEERSLVGHVDLDGRWLAVQCHCAKEAGEEPSLAWCITALRSLRR
jgi:hypothetical protein